jgi:hypothetical protein
MDAIINDWAAAYQRAWAIIREKDKEILRLQKLLEEKERDGEFQKVTIGDFQPCDWVPTQEQLDRWEIGFLRKSNWIVGKRKKEGR